MDLVYKYKNNSIGVDSEREVVNRQFFLCSQVLSSTCLML